MTSRLSASGYRRGIIFVLVIAMASVYIFRLMQLQIFERSVFEEKAAMNSIKAIEDVPLRGVFYDRNLKLLVENTPTYTVRITPAEYKKTSDSLLEAVLNIPSGAIRSILQKNKQYSKFTPVKIKRGVDFASIGWIEENSEKLVGVSYIIEMQRDIVIRLWHLICTVTQRKFHRRDLKQIRQNIIRRVIWLVIMELNENMNHYCAV